jgi:3-hydroxy-9,10-secoandrosta-1,3,5(10)-triene-9,17-dione monooxygenase reductase component
MTLKLDPVIDSAMYRRVLGHYPTGVCVVTATLANGQRAGMVVGSFTSVSLDPPLVGFFPDISSSSWPQIESAGKFCVNILANDQKDLCRRFSAKGEDKFAGLTHRLSTNGSPVLDDVVAWIDCTLDKVHEAGDHYIVLGRVRELDVIRPQQPLLFFRGGYGSFAPLIEQI